MTKVTVRWLDGFVENFECSEMRFSPGFIWLVLSIGVSRWIPTQNVRAFSVDPDSKMVKV